MEPGTPGTPNKLLFIQSSSGDFSDELRVLDLSPSVTFSTFQAVKHDAFYSAVEKAAKSRQNDSSAWAYEANRKTFSSKLQIHDTKAHGDLAAELDLSVLKHYGTWRLSFPRGSRHSSHDVDICPGGMLRKQETFTADDGVYVWDMAGKRGELYKVVDGRRMLVAEFVAKSWFANSCVLVLDARMVGDVVCLGTCVAALNRDI